MSRFINPRHLLGATKNSLSGLVFAWKGEQAFRHEVLVLAVLALLLAATAKGAGECLLVLGGWLGVMVVELLNSADEESFDLVTTEWNERVKRGKDMASAAIFLAMVINAGIWAYVFLIQ
ncbi:diacylglycerol kinase [uncultured Bilophila sp.]|uniref:diacylglycerol kinase n=1 Tax=uncultured Bilophila sp. TaxID=529385 RepID=UPI00262466C7|nr:diacylglycerol kinase [uncultured Bilophila sp.]